MDYDFRRIEQKWQARWAAEKTFRAVEDPSKPKYYVLDMFPYPSGAGLHVGHPLGYIASDIYARYKRLKGFNVLHPMGYDAFGLPAEQYAIQTGQHPEVTTVKNIARYREQLDRIGFSYDWDREVRTCDPAFYKWTQWAFIKMFKSYYNTELDKARPISELEDAFGQSGTRDVHAACTEELTFTAGEWKSWNEKKKAEVLMNYRIAYQGETSVNWCPGLGTVLANDEVKEGLSVRGGFPVEQKKMMQWQLRVSAYAGRLLDGLDKLDWTDSLKEMQRNWIGRSYGTEVVFKTFNGDKRKDVTIFTTRVDTIFGVTFMVLAPESELVPELVTEEQKAAVEEYLAYVKKKTERERISETKTVTGVFSGSYAENPLTGKRVPVWISEYVLAGYGTGAIMAVPAHDSRDYAFAKKFGLPIVPIIEGCDVSESSFDAKEGIMMNSGFLNGMQVKDAIEAAKEAAKKGIRVYMLGIGDPNGAPIPIQGSANYILDEEGNVVVSKLNEDMCREIAKAGNGSYIYVDNSSSAQLKLTEQINRLAKTRMESMMYNDFDEQYQGFVLLGLFFLLLDIMLMERENKRFNFSKIFSRRTAS